MGWTYLFTQSTTRTLAGFYHIDESARASVDKFEASIRAEMYAFPTTCAIIRECIYLHIVSLRRNKAAITAPKINTLYKKARKFGKASIGIPVGSKPFLLTLTACLGQTFVHLLQPKQSSLFTTMA